MKPKPSVDLYTAEDHLTPEELDKLKKAKKKEFKENQLLYSEKDLHKAYLAGAWDKLWNIWIKNFRKN